MEKEKDQWKQEFAQVKVHTSAKITLVTTGARIETVNQQKNNRKYHIVLTLFWLISLLYTFSYLTDHDFAHFTTWVGKIYVPIYEMWFGG